MIKSKILRAGRFDDFLAVGEAGCQDSRVRCFMRDNMVKYLGYRLSLDTMPHPRKGPQCVGLNLSQSQYLF